MESTIVRQVFILLNRYSVFPWLCAIVGLNFTSDNDVVMFLYSYTALGCKWVAIYGNFMT